MKGTTVLETITQLEFLFLDFIQQIKSPFWDNIFLFFTRLGNGAFIWILIAIIMLFIRNYRKTGLLILVSIAFVSLMFTLLVKNIVARERPYSALDIPLAFDAYLAGIPQHDTFSFPSGHAVCSFVSATCIFLKHKYIGILSYILALLISFSRLYMYVHFPSDVFFGAVFGILSALAVNWCEKKLSIRIRKRNSPN